MAPAGWPIGHTMPKLRTDAISAFLQVIRSSRILSDHQFEKLEANMAQGDYPSEPAELSSRLVKEGFLTEYQARQIQKGRSEGLNFGSYIILEFLGKGTMGKVYKARHRMMGRVYWGRSWLLLPAAAILWGIYARFKGLGTWALGVDEFYISRSIDFILHSGIPEFPCGGLYQRGLISAEEAYARAEQKDVVRQQLKM